MKRYIGIDPSTKTGIVILNEQGTVIEALEVTEQGEDPERMAKLILRVTKEIEKGDVVAIEGFGFASQSGFLLGGIGWGIRMTMYLNEITYSEVAPAALKKFAGGKGTMKKDELGVEIYKRWGFEHKSDNVRDAYVLAHIARALHEPVKLTVFQQEVINAIRSPAEKKKKRKAAKT